MISSLDGSAQGADGRSGTLGGDADRALFAMLRAMCDVILVGAGTARIERYGPAELNPDHLRLRGNRSPTSPIAVVSRSLGLDPSSSLFTEAEPRTIVVTVDSSPAQRRSKLARVADVIVAGDVDVDVPSMLAELNNRGLTRIACEGGPELLCHLLAADAVDELCLTTSPLTMGGNAPRIMHGAAGQLEWNLVHIIEDDSALFTRWTRRRL